MTRVIGMNGTKIVKCLQEIILNIYKNVHTFSITHTIIPIFNFDVQMNYLLQFYETINYE